MNYLDNCLSFLQSGDVSSAQAELDAAKLAGVDGPDIKYLQAQVYLVGGSFGLALPLLISLKRKHGTTPQLLANVGFCLSRLGRRAEAIRTFEVALTGDRNDPDLLYNFASVLSDVGDYARAESLLTSGLGQFESDRMAPNLLVLLAAVLIKQERLAESEQILTRRGLEHAKLFNEVLCNALISRANFTSCLSHIASLNVGSRSEALMLCSMACFEFQGTWGEGFHFLESHFRHLDHAEGYWRCALTTLYNSKQFDVAREFFESSVPERFRSGDAFRIYLKARLELDGLGGTMTLVRREINKGQAGLDLLESIALHAVKEGCLAVQDLITRRLHESRFRAIAPLWSLTLFQAPLLQRKNCENYYAIYYPKVPTTSPKRDGFPPGPRRSPLRVGLLSGDFRSKHAVAKLLSGLTRRLQHSTSADYVLISSAPRSLEGEVREFTDNLGGLSWLSVGGQSPLMIARALECLHLDVLVDLSGFTEFNCQAALMRRPVAVQVNWLGFPGTLAGGAHDFIIGDSFVLPTGCERFYAERLVRLPCCYQPNDEHRVASVAPSNLRERLGISSSLVAGVFNTGHKLGAQNLLFWARLLLRTQALQLLILSPGKPFEENFRSLLRSEGVDVDRVVFTDSMAYEEHMMRFQACDFMLDTSPYGAHTTASEALWNGCPVFTVPGQTFASRVAGSLNHHAGLGDLANFDSYDSLLRAVQVLDSGNMTRLIELRGRLGQFNTGLPIFDSAQFFEHFEAALHRMVS